ncbi:hypothetical protein BC567DRAFT_223884 [Phyllosticta citribraziliensis]
MTVMGWTRRAFGSCAFVLMTRYESTVKPVLQIMAMAALGRGGNAAQQTADSAHIGAIVAAALHGHGIWHTHLRDWNGEGKPPRLNHEVLEGAVGLAWAQDGARYDIRA